MRARTAHRLTHLTTLVLLAALATGCDLDDPGTPCGATDALQWAPCDPLAPESSGCGEGHCVLQAGPGVSWGCEMSEVPLEPGEPCNRHAQCGSGVCIPGDLAPGLPGGYGVCAQLCTGESGCPGDSWCQPVAGGPAAVCVEQ